MRKSQGASVDQYGDVIQRIEEEGCEVPELVCKRCVQLGPIRVGPAPPTVGSYNPETNQIMGCLNRMRGGIGVATDVFGHELVHALDSCRGADSAYCHERVCTEIGAYSFCSCRRDSPLRRTGRTREQCIKDGAFGSTRRKARLCRTW